jgi:hypothetical protein
MFPNDAITKTINIPASGGIICPEILSASNETKTLLQGVIITDGANRAKIKIGENEYLDNQKNNFINLISPTEFTNQAITCERTNNKPFQFTITYVNYGLKERMVETIIQNPETGAEFYINKTFSYGDSIIVIFLTIFTLCIIAKIIYNFLFKNV